MGFSCIFGDLLFSTVGMLTFGCTCYVKLMLRVRKGWGRVGHVNVRLHLLRGVDATCVNGVGWGGACYRSVALAT